MNRFKLEFWRDLTLNNSTSYSNIEDDQEDVAVDFYAVCNYVDFLAVSAL